jgi:deazaflavin-dependent oxidoreductase (nitroreductase family)
MSAVVQGHPTTPPRILIRAFWLLHRAAYAVSGGRSGLQHPEAGARFGTMRLATVGRRSGQPRIAIVGYHEDGPNLVTLAMNGWGDTDPGWWLNLLANPETTVGLADGTRDVRARAASGDERERLWARFRGFPGWGDDIDALAARRPTETAVVVFEPRGVATSRVTAPAAAGREPTPVPVRAETTVQRSDGDLRRRLRLRHVWLIPGLGIALFASLQAEQLGLGILPLLAFTIIPDLPRLLGRGQPKKHGQMAARAVPAFNLLHQPALPLALLALSATGVLSPVWYAAAIAWLGHLALGLAIGDRVRTRDGYLRPLWPLRPGAVDELGPKAGEP